ncbi:MAG: FHA domain-containing protein, partial [Gemmatimonadota bacterium]
MSQLVLHDLTNQHAREFTGANVRIGRAATCEVVVSGPGKEVVSSVHVRFLKRDDGWVVEDLGSRNGSFLDGERLEAHTPTPIAETQVVRLGRAGPQFRVQFQDAAAFESTVMEDPEATLMAQDVVPPPPEVAQPSSPPPADRAPPKQSAPPPPAGPTPPKPSSPRPAPAAQVPPKQPAPPPPEPEAAPPSKKREEQHAEPPVSRPSEPAAPAVRVVLMDSKSGQQFDATGGRIRIGRGKECEMRPITDDDTAVSRVHAEIVLKPDRRVVVRDAQSRNGTWVNGKQILGEERLRVGERLQLGPTGPDLMVAKLDVVGAGASAETPAGAGAAQAPSGKGDGSAARPAKEKGAKTPAAEPKKPGPVRRSFGGKGATIFFNEMFQESSKKAARRTRIVIWSAVGVLVVAVIALFWYKGQLESRLERRFAAQQAAADSIRLAATAEYERLQQQLAAARAGSAPLSVVESLRVALGAAEARTTRLEASLERAQASLATQLAAGDSVRREAQRELSRLQTELNRAAAAGTPASLLDSLRQAVRAAEDSAAAIASRVNAVRGA